MAELPRAARDRRRAGSPRSSPPTAEARLGARHLPRRARAGRVRPGHDPRLGVHPPRPPREPGRERSSARPRHADRRLLRRRQPLRVRGRDARSSSATPTSCRWPAASAAGRTRAAPWITPAVAQRRAAQPLRPPHPAPRGRRGRPAEAAREPRCCCSARAASARPPRSTSRPRASARSASSTWTSSTRRTCSARSSTTWTASASARSTRRRRRSPQLNPDVDVVTYDVRFGADNVLDIIDGYDVIVDGTDNFPTRYLLNDASLLKRIPVVHGSIFRFEGQVTVFEPVRGPVLPLPAARAAAAGARAELRGGRRARRAARHHRLDPGARGDQAPPRPRRPARSAGCSRTTRSRSAFRTFKVRRDPECPACGQNAARDRDRRVRRPLPAARRPRRRHRRPATDAPTVVSASSSHARRGRRRRRRSRKRSVRPRDAAVTRARG